jgi:hypothetical protein
MLLIPLYGAALALNCQVAQSGRPADSRQPQVIDSTRDKVTTHTSRHGDGRRLPVTDQLRASAFKDATARTALLQARVARMRQDSALKAYDAMSYQRISVGMSLTSLGRNRLLFRHEAASRVRWQEGVGAWVEVKGARTALPSVGNDEANKEAHSEMNDPDMMGSIPYYPGYEPLWVAGDMAKSQVDETEIVNPIAEGAEAYYTYETGDSLSFRLPNGTVVQLRELRFRARQPKWNLVVGSMWLDTRTGQVVRAAYRLSVPLDAWEVAKEDDPHSTDDVPKWVMPMISPIKIEISSIGVEYGLYEGRFWLPRLRVAEASAQVSFMHVPVKFEESFKYASVNARDSLPPINFGAFDQRNRLHAPDSLTGDARLAWLDSARAANRAKARASADSVRRGLKPRPPRQKSACDTSDTRVAAHDRFDNQLRVAIVMPCDESKLEHSAELPGSIYDSEDEIFNEKDLDDLKAAALSMSAQAPFSVRMRFLPPPTITYGPSMLRYNRVEGLSVGAAVDQELGGGYQAEVIGRLGFADLEPNVELGVTRTNLSTSIGARVYNRLVSASDWGRPLSFGSSFSALMFGRDEGFYYRASGVELNGGRATPLGGARLEWRAFAEQQRTAKVNTDFAVNGADFEPNLTASRGMYEGVSARINHEYGLDPNGLRLFTDLRVEAAYGDSAYGRGALDFTASHGLGRLAGAVTLSGGSSIGALPAQRMWYLGGSQTVRGQSPDTAQSGNAFWMTRLELGSSETGFRPTVFGDLGWVGDRSKLSQVGQPMSGVGTGVSFMDGLFRFDVARGIHPRKQWRVDLYLESKF